RFEGVDTRTVVEWFDLGGTLPLSDTTSADDVVARTHAVQGLSDLVERSGIKGGAPAPLVASAIDFVLEGLHAQKKIGRSDARGTPAAEPSAPRRRRRDEPQMDEGFPMPGGKKKYYN